VLPGKRFPCSVRIPRSLRTALHDLSCILTRHWAQEGAVYQLLGVFLDILRLRKGPQALPTSGFLLRIVLMLHFLLGVILISFTLSLGEALLGALVGTALVVALVYLALYLRSLSHRFVQTAAALAGIEFLLALFTLPFTAAHQGDGSAVLATVVALIAVGWSFAVTAHIARHALNLSAWKGFVAALVYMVISYAVAGLFTGPGA
jgi:hypothetical protein